MIEPVEPIVYQIKIVLRSISPLIWRRVLVRSDSSIADLHHILQIVMGWTDAHLHCFLIHGTEYGIAYMGGISFTDDSRKVLLANFQFRPRERFLYEYDFGDGWQHDIRIEQILPFDRKRTYPMCIAGKRAAPPEDCGGPCAYLELRRQYSVRHIAWRLAEILHDEDIREHTDELHELRRWLKIDCFNRQDVNDQLKKYAAKDKARKLE